MVKDRDELFCPVNVSVHISEYKNSISYSFSLELFTYLEVMIKCLSCSFDFLFCRLGRLKPIPRMEYNYIMCSPVDITERQSVFNGLQISCREACPSCQEKDWLLMFTVRSHFSVSAKSLSSFTSPFLIVNQIYQHYETKYVL